MSDCKACVFRYTLLPPGVRARCYMEMLMKRIVSSEEERHFLVVGGCVVSQYPFSLLFWQWTCSYIPQPGPSEQVLAKEM